MTFTYYKKTGEANYSHNGHDDYEDVGDPFEYEVEDIDVHMAIAEIIYENYIKPYLPNLDENIIDEQGIVKSIWSFIVECDDLIEQLEKVYYDELYVRFEDRALANCD